LAMEKIDGFDPVNIATGQPCTVKDVLKMLLAIDGYQDAEVTFDASKPTMIPKRLIDISKARSLLGFQSRVPMEEGLRKTVDWYRNSTGKESARAHLT